MEPAVGALAFWEDSLKYLYLSRLRSRSSLAEAVRTGATSKDFFGTAYGQTGGKFEGFQFGDGDVAFNDTLLLIEPEAATKYAWMDAQSKSRTNPSIAPKLVASSPRKSTTDRGLDRPRLSPSTSVAKSVSAATFPLSSSSSMMPYRLSHDRPDIFSRNVAMSFASSMMNWGRS